MPVTLRDAEIEPLAGRPGAFTSVVEPLLGPPPTPTRTTEARGRWGFARAEPLTRSLWWAWPWALNDAGGSQPDPLDAGPDGLPMVPVLWLSLTAPDTVVHLYVPRVVADTQGWLDRLTARLRARTHRAELELIIHGPREIAAAWAELGGDVVPDPIRAARAFARRELDLSSCERELVAALDAGDDPGELWSVVADELQRRGDPTGESLALALARARATDQPSRARALDQAYREREAARVARAPSHAQRLAYVDERGLSFAARELEPGGLADAPAFDGALAARWVWLWAVRVGPFCVRMLAQTDDPALADLGLPEVLLDAPELRYLSPRRLATLGPAGGDVSGQDLSGFRLTALARGGDRVDAYRASLRGVDLGGADLTGWQLDEADLRGAVGDVHTRMGGASFVGAVASPPLHRLIVGWNQRNGVERLLGHAGLRSDEAG